MIFKESDLYFDFSAAWQVHPFDDHRYYQGLSGLGFRGVDFIGLYRDQLILIEVKNYRKRKGMPEGDALQVIREESLSFIAKMEAKVRDSLHIVDLIDRYYQRRWLSRSLQSLPPKIRRRLQPRRHFWYQVIERAQEAKSCLFVLWLEADSDTRFVKEEIIPSLTHVLKDAVREVWLAGRGLNPFGDDLRFSPL